MGGNFENHDGHLANANKWKGGADSPEVFKPNGGATQLISRKHRVEETSDEMRYDSTGMFHWCKPRRISEAQLTKEQCAQLNLQVFLIT